MPRPLKCECGACATCKQREYMRRDRAKARAIRDIVWPNEEPWGTQAARVAEDLMRYECPLAKAVRYAEGVLERAKRVRADAMGAVMESDWQEGGVQ